MSLLAESDWQKIIALQFVSEHVNNIDNIGTHTFWSQLHIRNNTNRLVTGH